RGRVVHSFIDKWCTRIIDERIVSHIAKRFVEILGSTEADTGVVDSGWNDNGVWDNLVNDPGDSSPVKGFGAELRIKIAARRKRWIETRKHRILETKVPSV